MKKVVVKKHCFVDGGVLYRKLQRDYRKQMKIFHYIIKDIPSGKNGTKKPYWYKLEERPLHTTMIDGRFIKGKTEILAEGKYNKNHRNVKFYDKYLGSQKPHDVPDFLLDEWLQDGLIELTGGFVNHKGKFVKNLDLLVDDEIFDELLRQYPEFKKLRSYLVERVVYHGEEV